MSMKVVVDNVVVGKGTSKDGKPYYFIEVQETVRKYLNPNSPKDLVVLDDLADKNVAMKELVLHQRNNNLVFSAELQDFSK